MNRSHSHTAAIHSPVRYFFLATVFFLTLTGFGQMPIFKRYYIADIPGLGWLADCGRGVGPASAERPAALDLHT